MRLLPLPRLSSLALAGALALASCQSSSSDADTPAPTGQRTNVVVVYKFPKSDPWRVADSLTWSAPGQSGSGLHPRLLDSAGTSRSYLAALTLNPPLRDSLLTLQLYRFGVRFMHVGFRAMGATDTLTLGPGTIRYDSVALALLRGMDSLKTTLPQTREGLLNLYGTWILAGDARVKGFPASLPIGIAAPQAIQAALVAASRTGKPLAEQAKTWSLGISTDSAQTLILELLRTGKIASKDSSSLFPPPPVRVVVPLAVGTGLRAGGTSVGITGAFAWDQGLGLVVLQGEVTRDGQPDTNLVVYGLPVPKSTDREVKLDGAASLLAKASAPEGTYVLTITAQDGAQHKAISRDTFTVAAKLPDQPQAPRIHLLSPSDKSIVPFETAEVATTWIASTPQGTLSSVKVDGAVADKVNDSTWQGKVRLEPTGKARTIVAKATNSAGLEAVATLELTRQADTARPGLTWVAGGRSVDFDSAEVVMSVKASDNDSLASVTISGLVASGNDGVFTARVKLEVGDNPVQVVAVDRTGNKDALRATVHRYQKLSITRVSPTTPDTTVAAGIGSVALSWKVSGAKAVGVGDSVLTAAGGLYTWTANNSGSAAKVVLWATDSAGRRDTSVVGVMVRAAPKPRHDLDSGHFVRYWKPLHLVSEGADSIQWSIDGTTWTRYKDSVRVDCDSCRILSRAWPGPSIIDTTGTFWIRKVKSVAAGGYHSMFLMQDGTVWACGKNNSGRLGDGTFEMRTMPVRVLQDGKLMTDVVEVYGGGRGSLFVKKNRDLYGVGSPASQIKDPTIMELANPVRMGGNVSKISYWDNAMWTTPQGTAIGFGVSPSWYSDSVVTYAERPIMYDQASRVPWSGIVDVANGYSVQYILDSRRGLYAARDGWSDALQINTYPAPYAVSVYKLAGSMKRIEVDWYGRLYALSDAGTLYELTLTDKADSLVAVEIYPSPNSYALGTALYVLTSEGRILGRGANDFGQLGTGAVSASLQSGFSQVFPDHANSKYIQVATGYTHAIALQSDGSVWMVGGNEQGQLGNGTTFDQYTPIQVTF